MFGNLVPPGPEWKVPLATSKAIERPAPAVIPDWAYRYALAIVLGFALLYGVGAALFIYFALP
jgi:hypothetical protein